MGHCAKTAEKMIHIAENLLVMLKDHARSTWPEECCGVLIGSARGDDTFVDKVVTSANIADADRRRRYQIDWQVLLRSYRTARGAVRSVVGFYHSHPDGSARPSRVDLQDALPDHLYIIVTVDEGSVTDVTAWRLDSSGAQLVPEEIVVSGRAGREAHLFRDAGHDDRCGHVDHIVDFINYSLRKSSSFAKGHRMVT